MCWRIFSFKFLIFVKDRKNDDPILNYLVNLFRKQSCPFVKGTTSPAERCDLGDVKLEKVHEFFHVCLNLCQRNCDNMWLVMARYEIKVSQIYPES